MKALAVAAHQSWGLAIIMIVIASWLFYRYAAPKRWREWERAGVVQAFIIALYAEMYGFPITLYILVRGFGLDVPISQTGNLWSSLLDYGETGMFIAMLLGYAFALVGIMMLIKGWRQAYRARRDNRVATTGLYGLVRHPQYTGIFLAAFGEGVVHWPTIFSVALFPVIVFAYVSLARKEEKEMIERFGEEYRDYQRRVPMFLPRRDEWGQLIQVAFGKA